MESLINDILTDPTFIKVGIVLAILIALALFKKLFKLVLILIVALIIYIAYLAYTGEDIDTKKVKKQIEKSLDDAKEKVDDALDDIKDIDTKTLKKKRHNTY